ncbi:MAG: flagellar hook-basal body complex protein FliE [Thermodesulfobacteriota bacterium]
MSDLKIGNMPQISLGNSGEAGRKNEAGFGEAIKGAVTKVSKLEREADESIIDMLQGKADVSQTMVALQKSDISLRLVLAVRNKVLEAYREIMNMQF